MRSLQFGQTSLRDAIKTSCGHRICGDGKMGGGGGEEGGGFDLLHAGFFPSVIFFSFYPK